MAMKYRYDDNTKNGTKIWPTDFAHKIKYRI
jgi:hypothetical protein